MNAVQHALTRHHSTHPVAELGRHQCTPDDLRKLNGLNWLNDEVRGFTSLTLFIAIFLHFLTYSNVQFKNYIFHLFYKMLKISYQVINYYLQLIQQRSVDDTSLPSVYSFNTFLFPRLQDQGHAGVKR